MVLGHVIGGYLGAGFYPESAAFLRKMHDIIYSFHMPLFMMISGYVYCKAYSDSNDTFDKKRIYRQIGNQVGVYVIFSELYGFTKIFFSASVNREIKPIDLALIGIKPIDLFWYLYVLILLYMFFSTGISAKVNRYLLLGAFIVSAMASQLVTAEIFMIDRFLYYVFYFYVGMSYKKYKNWIIGNKVLTPVLFCMALVFFKVFWNVGDIRTVWGVKMIVALGISLALWYLFEHVVFLKDNFFFRFLGKYSLEIYVMHCFFKAGLRVVFSRIGAGNVCVSILLSLIISVAVPVLISMFCQRAGIYDLLFKPSLYLRKCKKQQ